MVDTPERHRIPHSAVTGLILAGGAGRRMGGADKGLLEIAGRPLVAWVLAALAPQTGRLLISANRNLARYATFGVPVVEDRCGGFQGPLAGIAAALDTIETGWLLVSPCDTPLLPRDLAARLSSALVEQRAVVAIGADTKRSHPLHALIPRHLAGDLAEYLDRGGRSVLGWVERHRPAVAGFADDVFCNINRPEDRTRIAVRLERLRTSGTDAAAARGG